MGSAKLIAKGRFLALYDRDGWEYAERPNADGVVGVLALTPGEEVVLIEQYRHPVESRVIEIPAGLIGDHEIPRGESVEDCARRELLEETGYRAATITPLLTSPTSAGMTPELTHLFLARDLVREHDGGGVAGEDITVHLVPRTQVRAWLAARQEEGLLVDFKIHAALCLAGLADLQ